MIGNFQRRHIPRFTAPEVARAVVAGHQADGVGAVAGDNGFDIQFHPGIGGQVPRFISGVEGQGCIVPGNRVFPPVIVGDPVDPAGGEIQF